MNLTRYVCSHCGRRFEAEEKEIVECPGCFWSTSVRKEGEAPSENETPRLQSAAPKASAASGLPLPPLRVILSATGILLVLVVVFVAAPAIFHRLKSSPGISPKLSKKERAAAKKKAEVSPASGPSSLSSEEKNILARRLQPAADRPVSPEEEKVLDRHAEFQTGIVEKLPSQSWSLANFKEMIAEQERFYKVPLPGSYKKKMEEVFRSKYLAAEEAFGADQLEKARNLWIESLIFPVYGGDPVKHRGVVLTMIRPFINDTLSKIGAINGTLAERKIREKEAALTRSYAEFLGLIKQKSFSQAYAMILTLDQQLDLLEKPNLLAGSGPAAPYPLSIGQVDEGIRSALLEIQTPPPPAVSDPAAVREDIRAKRKVLESFIAARLEEVQTQYDDALSLIRRESWDEAEKKLREIQMPLELANDARQKIKLIEKIKSGAGAAASADS